MWQGARYFDRCAAGLGIKETEGRLELVRSGECTPRLASEKPRVVVEPAEWELRQLHQFGQTQQLSCNPAKYFVQANDQCPLAYRQQDSNMAALLSAWHLSRAKWHCIRRHTDVVTLYALTSVAIEDVRLRNSHKAVVYGVYLL